MKNKTLNFEGNFIASEMIISNPEFFDKKGNLLITSIGGIADFRNWSGSADNLTSIGGSAYFRNWSGSADNLTSIGGIADFRNWSGSANNLTSIGGSAYFRNWSGSAKKIFKLYKFSEEIGSRNAICLFEKKTKEYRTGCFCGNAKKLIESVNNRHLNNEKYRNQYLEFIKQCEN